MAFYQEDFLSLCQNAVCSVSTTLFILQAEKELKRRRTGSLDDEDEDEDEDEVDEGMDEGEGRGGR